MNRIYIICLLLAASLQIAAQTTLKVQSGAIIKTTGGAVITLQDMDLDNDGIISQSAGEGTFRFSGTTNTAIGGSSSALIDVLQLAKTGGAKVSLLQNVNIGSSINFTSGLIDLSNKNILLQPAALLIGESETSRITGTTGGYIEISAVLNNPNLADPGNLGANITAAANMGNTIIRRGHAAQTINGVGSNSILRYYDIIPTNNSGLNATLNFSYWDNELNGLTENTLTLWKNPDNTVWTDQGFSRRSVITNFVEKSGVADFSRWTLSTSSIALPVIFSLFNTACNGDKVTLTWKTAQEQNSNYFEIQRSDNGNNFTAIGRVPAAGFSNVEKTYTYTDYSTTAAKAFYRIAEFDADGRSQYTSILRSQCGTDMFWKAWPNPVQEKLFITIGSSSSSTAVIKIFDAKGALVKLQSNALLAGNNLLTVDMRGFVKGTYHIVTSWDNGTNQQSFVVVKE